MASVRAEENGSKPEPYLPVSASSYSCCSASSICTGRLGVDRRIEGGVDHCLADADELAADGEVVDGAAVILGVDDGGGVGGEPTEILRDSQLADRLLRLEEGLERDRRRALAAEDQLGGRLVKPPVQRVVEMRGLQEARDAVDRLVVDEDRPEKGLLGFEIMRRRAENRRFGCRQDRISAGS